MPSEKDLVKKNGELAAKAPKEISFVIQLTKDVRNISSRAHRHKHYVRRPVNTHRGLAEWFESGKDKCI